MKKAYLIGSLIAVALAPAAMAIPATGTISLTQNAGASYGDGGQLNGVINYGSGGTIQTFCVEELVMAQAGTTYNYTTGLTDGNGQPLVLGTAWLYNAFLNNQSLIPTYVSNPTQAALMQGAVWFFQNQAISGDPMFGMTNPLLNPYIVDAETALGSHVGDSSIGQYDVVILDLSDANGTQHQNVLGQLTPTVPDGGSTVALLGFAMLGFESLRRKLAR